MIFLLKRGTIEDPKYDFKYFAPHYRWIAEVEKYNIAFSKQWLHFDKTYKDGMQYISIGFDTRDCKRIYGRIHDYYDGDLDVIWFGFIWFEWRNIDLPGSTLKGSETDEWNEPLDKFFKRKLTQFSKIPRKKAIKYCLDVLMQQKKEKYIQAWIVSHLFR